MDTQKVLKKLKQDRLKLAVQMARLEQILQAEKDAIKELERELEEAKRYQ
jgi:hypothetical protein